MVRSVLISRKCTSSETLDTCEKPTASTNTVLGILVGVGYEFALLSCSLTRPLIVLRSVVLFLIVLCVLYFLHLRRKRFDKAEMENDPHELSDYGLDEIPAVKKGGKKGAAKSNSNLDIPDIKSHRLSAQELLEAQNPFGNGAELADSDKVTTPKSGSPKSGSPPPQYPGEAHRKV